MDLIKFNSVIYKEDKLSNIFDNISRYYCNDKKTELVVDLPKSFQFKEGISINMIIRNGLSKQNDLQSYEDLDYNHPIINKSKYVLYGKVYKIEGDSLAISCGGLIVYFKGEIKNLKEFVLKQHVLVLIN